MIVTTSLEDVFMQLMKIKDANDFVDYNLKDINIFLNNLNSNGMSNGSIVLGLLTYINILNGQLNSSLLENDLLNLNKINIEEELNILKNSINGINKRALQYEKVKAGQKIAYKDDASCEKVLTLYRKGMTRKEIAEQLGVSRKTIDRRVNTLIKEGMIKINKEEDLKDGSSYINETVQ